MNRVAHCTCISQLFQKERVCRIGLGVRLSFLPPAETELQRYPKGLAKHELPTHEKDPLSAEIIAGPMSHSQTGLAEAPNLLSRVHGLALERSIRSLVGSTRYAVPVHQNQRRRASVPPTRRSGSQLCGFSEGGWVFSRNPFPLLCMKTSFRGSISASLRLRARRIWFQSSEGRQSPLPFGNQGGQEPPSTWHRKRGFSNEVPSKLRNSCPWGHPLRQTVWLQNPCSADATGGEGAAGDIPHRFLPQSHSAGSQRPC